VATNPNTCYVLSFDGGGNKGYISSTFLKRFVTQWEIPQNSVRDHFDVICGTSIGGIQAAGYANGLTPQDLRDFFVNDGPWIFSTNPAIPGLRASILDKVQTILFGGSFYPNTNLLAKLTEVFGNLRLSDLTSTVLMTSYNDDTDTPIFFSNYPIPEYSGTNEYVRNTTLATGSAPLYFPKANFSGANYVDGGICQNNPCQLGLTLAKIKKPLAKRFVVLSIGTGLKNIGFQESLYPDEENAIIAYLLSLFPGISDNQIKYLFSLIEKGINGPQEITAMDLKMQDEYTLQNLHTYRFNFTLDPNVDTGMDNTTTEFYTYMNTATNARYDADTSNITTFLGHLTA